VHQNELRLPAHLRNATLSCEASDKIAAAQKARWAKGEESDRMIINHQMDDYHTDVENWAKTVSGFAQDFCSFLRLSLPNSRHQILHGKERPVLVAL
jgi:hypothetical protein